RETEHAVARGIALEAARTSAGASRGPVGEQRVGLDMVIGTAVADREELGDVAPRYRAVGAEVGAHVDPDLAAQRNDGAVVLAQQLELAVHLARVVGGEQVLAPVLDPLHRAAELARGPGNEKVLGIELAAHAEAAADVALDHVDAFF